MRARTEVNREWAKNLLLPLIERAVDISQNVSDHSPPSSMFQSWSVPPLLQKLLLDSAASSGPPSCSESYIWPNTPAHMKGKKLEENASGNLAHSKGKMTEGVVDHMKAMKLGSRTKPSLDSCNMSSSRFLRCGTKQRR